MFRKLKQWFDNLQPDEIIAIICFVILAATVAYLLTTNDDSEEESMELIGVSAVESKPEVTDWPGSATLAEDEAAIAYAAALDTHLRNEWAGAAEAARVIEAQRAEQARQAAASRAQQPQRAESRRQAAPAPQQAHSGGSGSCSALPAYIAERESGCSYGAVNSTGCSGRGCYGAYQFDPATWDATAAAMGRPDLVGGAAGASPADQDAVAAALWNGGAGCSHWSACG